MNASGGSDTTRVTNDPKSQHRDVTSMGFAHLIRRALRAGGTDEDLDRGRKAALMNFMTLIGIACLVPLGVVSLLQGKIALGAADLGLAAFVAASLIDMWRTGRVEFAIRVSLVGTAGLFFYVFVTGGSSGTGFMWTYTFPLFAHFLLGSKLGARATALLFLPACGYLALDVLYLEPSLYSTSFASRFVPSFLVVHLFSFLFERTREEAQLVVVAKRKTLEETIDTLQRTELELREAQEHLEVRITQRTEELETANARLVREMEHQIRTEAEKSRLQGELVRAQKLELVGTLAGGVAHDLNNILSGIVSYPDLVLLDLEEDSPLREPMVAIQRSGERAVAVVQDLLTLARRSTNVKEVVDLNAAVEGLLAGAEWSQFEANHPGVCLVTDFAPDLLHVRGSPVHLMKAAMNLIVNGAEAMPDGGELSISTSNRYIDVPLPRYEYVAEGEYVTLSVTDMGEGVSPEDLSRIFEPFYSKKKLGRSGSGLGLSVVHGTVQDHEGYVDVVSAAGQGTTFTLYFPASRQPLVDAQAPIDLDAQMGRGESVLVVDDVKPQREISADILTRLGYHVASVASGEEAVAYLQDRTVDLILLDMIMDPGIDGLETYRQIVSMRPGQRAVIASGYSESHRVDAARALGAGPYVRKPFSVSTLGKAVREELDRVPAEVS